MLSPTRDYLAKDRRRECFFSRLSEALYSSQMDSQGSCRLCSSLTKYRLRGHTQITHYTTLFCQTGTQRKAVTAASPIE